MPDGMPPLMIITAPAPKPWWRSRTLIVNAVALALAGIESQLGALQPLLPVNVYAAIAVALPVVNMLLRGVTWQPIASSTPPATAGYEP